MNPRSLFYVEKWPGVDFRWGSLFFVTPAQLVVKKFTGSNPTAYIFSFWIFCLHIEYGLIICIMMHNVTALNRSVIVVQSSIIVAFCVTLTMYCLSLRNVCHRTASDLFPFLLHPIPHSSTTSIQIKSNIKIIRGNRWKEIEIKFFLKIVTV